MTMVITREEQDVLPALTSLFVTLERRGVRYCHWKSNYRLSASLRGKTDLDLLVDGRQRLEFRQLLAEHDVIELRPAPDKAYSAIEHYLGFDVATGRLFHLHVHYELVLGEQHVKNYRLPLEEPFLQRVHSLHGVCVPVPELELMVLALRALLKYRDRDGLKDLLGIRGPGLPRHIREEIGWLREQSSPTQMDALLAELSAVVPGEEIASFLSTVAANPRDGARLLALRRRVRRALAGYQRRSRLRSALSYFARSGQRTLSYARLTPKKKMSLPEQGIAIAFVGADGAGKSTIVDEIARWLSWRLNVRVLYMGSSRPSPATRLLKSLTSLSRLAEAGSRRLLGRQRRLSALVASGHRHLLALRYVAEAADRYRRWRAGSRDASRGWVVIYDRYPLPGVAVGDRAMDGPRAPSLFPEGMSKAGRRLAQLEAGFYARIPPPEPLFVLHVSPEVSQARKPGHAPAAIQAKSQALADLAQRDGTNGAVIHVEADRPLDEVLGTVKRALWPLL